jgi:hypothetical protein
MHACVREQREYQSPAMRRLRAARIVASAGHTNDAARAMNQRAGAINCRQSGARSLPPIAAPAKNNHACLKGK